MRYYLSKIRETDSRMVGARGWGEGELLFNGDRISDCKLKSSWDWLYNNVNIPYEVGVIIFILQMGTEGP